VKYIELLSQGDSTEGDVMRRWLIRLGVPENKVFVESYDLRSYVLRWMVFPASGQARHESLGLFWYHLKYG